MDLPLRTVTASNGKPWFILYDQWPKPNEMLGQFNEREVAEEKSPALLSLYQRNLDAKAAAIEKEKEARAGKPVSIKRKVMGS